MAVKIGEMLLKAGYISQEQLNEALDHQKKNGGKIGYNLVKLGFVREGTLREDCVVNGEVSDSWVYGLIRRDWRPSSEPVLAR